ncbi:pilus biosynthesis protein PilP [Betaproteobacteria bacterium]|nr:pilus biosynthesis protein PilP [Betaproteobacteria bacterium]
MMRGAFLVLMCCALGLGACSSERDNIRAWMDEQATGMKGRVDPLPEIKVFPVVEYVIDDVAVEPFAVSRIVPVAGTAAASTTGLQPKPHPKEPLEAYPLESLKMVGRLSKDHVVHALIRADKALYQVAVGAYMGQDYGVVTAIREDAVELRELVQDMNGDWVERTSSLLLQEAEAVK